jgi:hypothetical protein
LQRKGLFDAAAHATFTATLVELRVLDAAT